MNRPKDLLRLISLIMSASLLAGCASIVSNSSYPVSISSTPEGATATIRNASGRTVHSGQTPTTVTLNAGDGFFKKTSYTVEFEKTGYRPAISEIHSTLDGWYFGNIVFGGLIGILIVDPATGAMWRLPDYAHANLSALEVEPPDGETQLQILTPEDVPAEMRKDLVPLN